MIKHASLFSGIGGFDIAATWMGWQNVFSCEKDAFCRKILKYYWPETHHYEDIYQFNALKYRDAVDIITGGFPCQPFSSAGKRRGTQDDRYLWPQARRIITEARPRCIVLENVAGLFTILEPETLSEVEIKEIELFCQDDRQPSNVTVQRLQRRVIGSIISEIAAAGYVLPQMEDGTPVVLCVPACAAGAPHRRDRLWFIAYADEAGAQSTQPGGNAAIFKKPEQEDTICGRIDGTIIPDRSRRNAINGIFSELATGWERWPSEPPFCGLDDGLPRELDGTTFPKWRDESIKGYGNAIVPKVAFEIFRSIAANYFPS